MDNGPKTKGSNHAAETALAVALPEGTYTARATLAARPLDDGTAEPVVRITMDPGHAIPVGRSGETIDHYAARASSFNEALEALVSLVLAVREMRQFSAPAFEAVEVPYPPLDAPGWRMVRVRRLDGTAAHVPAGTAVVPVSEETARVLAEPIDAIDPMRRLFARKARPVEKQEGRWVLGAPAFGALTVAVMFVEGMLGVG